jgi:hypothetical protein
MMECARLWLLYSMVVGRECSIVESQLVGGCGEGEA